MSGVLRRWWGVAALTLLAVPVIAAIDHGRSWHWFADAGDGLVGGAGLDLFVERPDLQFGPVMAVIAAALRVLPEPLDLWLAIGAGALAGVAVLALIEDVVVRLRPDADPATVHRSLRLAAVPFLAVWLRMAVFTTHLDDVIVLTLLTAAVAAVARERSGWTVVLVALAVAVKPWAVVAAPLAAVGRDSRPVRLARVATVLAVPALTWAPFLVAAPETVASLRSHALPIDSNSGLALLGLTGDSFPGWVRPVQAVGGLLAAGWAVRVGAWHRALAAGLAVRLLVDPSTNHYYGAGLTVGLLIWELTERPRSLPWRTLAALAVLEITADGLHLGGGARIARALVLVAVIAASVRPSTTPAEAGRRRSNSVKVA